MNTLSWLIYLAEVLSSADNFAGAVAAITVTLAIFSGAALMMFRGENGIDMPFIGKIFKTTIVICTITSLIAIILPSKQTIILIAASELGQAAIQSEGAQRVIDPSLRYVESWLNNEIERLRSQQNR